MGGRTAGGRGTVQIVVINNTPYRAVFTVGLYDQTDPGFAPAFEQFGHQEVGRMLEAGGTMRLDEMLAPFGLDASAPDFWRRGLGVISAFIDELEAMDG